MRRSGHVLNVSRRIFPLIFPLPSKWPRYRVWQRAKSHPGEDRGEEEEKKSERRRRRRSKREGTTGKISSAFPTVFSSFPISFFFFSFRGTSSKFAWDAPSNTKSACSPDTTWERKCLIELNRERKDRCGYLRWESRRKCTARLVKFWRIECSWINGARA